jgi:hypothetical protein
MGEIPIHAEPIQFRKAQKLKRSSSQKPEKKEAREKLVIAAHIEYIDTANSSS